MHPDRTDGHESKRSRRKNIDADEDDSNDDSTDTGDNGLRTAEMISGRQYYEMPPAGQAMASAYSGIRRFDPDYGLDYGHDMYGFEYQTDHRSMASRAVPGTGAAGARQSLSALDEKRANEIRRGVYAHVFLDVKNSHKSDASHLLGFRIPAFGLWSRCQVSPRLIYRHPPASHAYGSSHVPSANHPWHPLGLLSPSFILHLVSFLSVGFSHLPTQPPPRDDALGHGLPVGAASLD
ncbi:hypothetical protein LZ30DRAFT_683620 [Colletotrichum cereale]|nr:hypothetical protein LZ30DRAFT_683620 [Colletotrichum cereale]